VLAYVKNHNLGFEVPYRCGAEVKRYRPTSSSASTTGAVRTTR
jgi:hypothetical protein